jgi:hypothetical protein
VRTPAAASRHALRAFAAPPSVPRKKARESESRFFARASRRSAFAEFILPDPRRKINIAERGRRTRSKYSDCPHV